jgi:hypothetical protein
MKKWNLVPVVALFGLIGAGCADGFSLTGARTIDDGNPAPVTVPAGAQQGNADQGAGTQDTLPENSGGGGAEEDPPATDPPATDPPATDPPTTEPPTTEPPTTEPPTTTTTAPPTTEPPTTTTEPAPTTTTTEPIREATITVTLIRFQAIGDCDGGLDGPGEFDFEAFVSTADGQVRGSTSLNGAVLENAAYKNRLEDVTFTLPEQEGSRFNVFFSTTERDRDIVGNVFADDRMNGRRTSAAHTFSGGIWTSPPMVSTDLGGTYPSAVQLLNGSGDCSAELHYVVDIT